MSWLEVSDILEHVDDGLTLLFIRDGRFMMVMTGFTRHGGRIDLKVMRQANHMSSVV